MPADDFFPDIFPITFQTFRREVLLLILETNVRQDCWVWGQGGLTIKSSFSPARTDISLCYQSRTHLGRR